jgi:hypothetical protein
VNNNKFIGILFVIAFLITSCLIFTRAEADVGMQDEKKILVPSPMEIRNYEPQPNSLMIVTYANERVFVYRIENIIHKPECNQVSIDNNRRIKIITQAPSQAYEYVLEPMPIMVSKWVRYDD